jgi:hypothetical protein
VINAVGSWASTVALSFGVLEQGSATALRLVFLAREIPIVVFVLAGGVWADRWSRGSILIGSANLMIAATVVILAIPSVRALRPAHAPAEPLTGYSS